MKKGWKVLIAVVLLLSVIEWVTMVGLFFMVRDLQEGRNRLWNVIDVHERLLEKQRTFNREYYHKIGSYKRADKEWPLNAKAPSTR